MIWQKKQNKTKTLKQIENQQKGFIFYSTKIDKKKIGVKNLTIAK